MGRAAGGLMGVYRRVRLAGVRLRRGSLHRWRGVRVLGYHRIADVAHPLAVHPDRFRAQMERVLASGASAVSVVDALDLLEAGEADGGRYVCVTFDDGYRDNLEVAEPVLRELGVPATIFAATAVVDGTATFSWFADPPPALSWDEVRTLLAGGLVDVQAHTRTHPRLPHVDDARARDEIEGSRRDLADRAGHDSTVFCYPAGLHGLREMKLAREAGYRAAFGTAPGVNVSGTERYSLKRTLVFWDDDAWAFEAKLGGLLDRPPLLRSLLYRRLAKAPA